MSSRIVSDIVAGTGRRLRQLRNHFNYSLDEMARKLGLSKSGYFKNEGGFSFPGLKTLDLLQRSYDISMDWFLFAKGPMNYTQKPSVQPPEENVNERALKDISPETLSLVEYMEQDPLLRAEMLVHYYRYREKRESVVSGKKSAPREKSK